MIPSRFDWGQIDENDLDANWALQQFLGKTFAQAEAMFAENALYYQEDLQSMPPAPFRFYAPALASYITSERARGDSDGASSFLRMLIWVFKEHPSVTDTTTSTLLMGAAEDVAAKQNFFEASTDIYGSFTDLLSELRTVVAQPTVD